MPDGIIPAEGVAGELGRRSNPAAWTGRITQLILWVNDLTPDADTVLADLTPASFEGYNFFTLEDDQWQPASVTDDVAVQDYGDFPLSWSVGDPAGNTIYGWAIVDVDAGVLRFVQRFDAGDIRPLASGDLVRLFVHICETSAAC